jgi:hypothetical protein
MACISASPLQFTNDIVLQFCSWYSCGNSSLSITFLIEKRDLNIPRNQWPTPLKSASNHLSILSWSTLLSYTSIWFQFNWAWFVTKGDLNMPHKAISSPQWNLRGLIHAMQSNGPLHQVVECNSTPQCICSHFNCTAELHSAHAIFYVHNPLTAQILWFRMIWHTENEFYMLWNVIQHCNVFVAILIALLNCIWWHVQCIWHILYPMLITLLWLKNCDSEWYGTQKMNFTCCGR